MRISSLWNSVKLDYEFKAFWESHDKYPNKIIIENYQKIFEWGTKSFFVFTKG